MKYFHTITPISDERRENRKNEIDAYINDIKKQLFSLFCEKASMDIKAEDYVGKKFKFNFNPYHYAIIDIKGIDAVIDCDDTKERIYIVFNLNTPYTDMSMDALTRGWVTTTLQDFFSVEKSELYKLEEISD